MRSAKDMLLSGSRAFIRGVRSSSASLQSTEGAAATAERVSTSSTAAAKQATSAGENAANSQAEKPQSPFLRAVSFAADTMFYSTLAAIGWGAWYSYQYKISEVETQVNDLRLKKQLNEANPIVGSQLYILSTYLNFRKFADEKLSYYQAPMQPKLLPDVEQIYGPYIGSQIRTLVVDLIGVLVAAEWTREKGWRYFKRPGVEDFLRQANELGFEVVVYTPSTQSLADPILDRIDPQRQLITARLYKDHTQYMSEGLFGGGYNVCDLSKLNRNLARTLFVGCEQGTWKLQPENAIKLKKWEGQSADTALLDLIPFLEMIRKTNAPDTRAIVRSYEGKDFIEEFKERVKSLSEQKKQQAMLQQQKPARSSLFKAAA